MKNNLIHLTILFVFILLPLTAQAEPFLAFEHRYEYKLEDVFPNAMFVKKQGYWEARRNGKTVGYAGLSKEWTGNLVGYSGKHLETLVAMDAAGVITGTKLVYHSEPIVLIGLKEESLISFLKQYQGKNIKDSVSVGGAVGIDALTGATVTAVVENSIILETLRKIASRAGILATAKNTGRRINKSAATLTWDELLRCGAVKNIKISSKELGLEGEEAYLDLFVASLLPPSIGKSLLGESSYNTIVAKLKTGEAAIALFARGKGSFKGTGFVRGGVFDRFNVEQGTRMHMLHDRDYTVLSELKAAGAPVINEGGVFVIRDKEFDAVSPFKLNLLLPYRASVTKKEFKSYSVQYAIPDRFLE